MCCFKCHKVDIITILKKELHLLDNLCNWDFTPVNITMEIGILWDKKSTIKVMLRYYYASYLVNSLAALLRYLLVSKYPQIHRNIKKRKISITQHCTPKFCGAMILQYRSFFGSKIVHKEFFAVILAIKYPDFLEGKICN